MQVDRKPKWDKWRHVPDVRIWEAVALSLNIEPAKIKHSKDGWMADTHLFDEGEEFRDRIFIAGRNLGGSGKALNPTAIVMGSPADSSVSLPAFAQWACSIDWGIPAELNAIGQSRGEESEKTKVTQQWPWGNYETELLRKLAAAVERFWVLYDPNDPTTAPTNQQVTEWLRTQGVADRNAEVIATILRVDGLPTGPRK